MAAARLLLHSDAVEIQGDISPLKICVSIVMATSEFPPPFFFSSKRKRSFLETKLDDL